MDSPLLIGLQQEKADLKQEVCGLQDELAESRAEKEELESRSRALQERVRPGVRGQRSFYYDITFNSLFRSLSLSHQALPVSLWPACSLGATG